MPNGDPSLTDSVAPLGGSRSGRVVLGANTLASGGNHESQLLGWTISGSGGLIENGSGVIPLRGENSHPGGTVNGTLMVAGHAALLRAGSTLQLATDQQGRFRSLLADSATLHGSTLAVEAKPSRHPLLRRYAVLSTVSGVSGHLDRALLGIGFARQPRQPGAAPLDRKTGTINLSPRDR